MKTLSFILLVLYSSVIGFAQVGIGTTMPESTLDIRSSNQAAPANNDGVLIPKVDEFPLTSPTLAQDGMMVFVTGNGAPAKGFYYWDNSIPDWVLINSSSVNDHDWYEEGSTNSPDDINDDKFTFGNLAIGKNTADYPVDIETEGERGVNISMNSSSDINQFGNTVYITSPDTYGKYGYSSTINSPGNGTHTGYISNVLNSGSGDHHGIYNFLYGAATGRQYGSFNAISATGGGDQYGTYNYLIGSGNSFIRGTKNYITNDSNANQFGVESEITGDGNGDHRGSNVILSGSGSGWHSGSYVTLNGNGTGEQRGFVASLSGTNTSLQRGVYVDISTDNNSSHYGAYNRLRGDGNGPRIGIRNNIEGNGTGWQYAINNYVNNTGDGYHYGVRNIMSGDGSGIHTGSYNFLSGEGPGNKLGTINVLNGAGAGNKYGSSNFIPPSAGGTHYGVHSEATKAGSYAGYFLGTLAIGTTNANIYSLPRSRGLVDQILRTDGSGNVTWQNIPNNNDSLLRDTDWDTRINVEESPDDDRIRMDIAGEENVVLRKNISGIFRMDFLNNNDNILIGENVGNLLNSTVTDNVAIGNRALQSNVSGTSNTAIGERVLVNATGQYNTGLGTVAMGGKNTGNENTSIGTSSLYYNYTGSGNVALGRSAGSYVDGNNNVFIGSFSGQGSTQHSKSGSVFIGNSSGSNETGSNKLYIENSNADANNALIYGEFDTNLLRVNGNLEISGETNLHRNVATGVALRVNGSEALWYNGTYFSWGFGGTANYFADNVGMGTTTPDTRMHVEGGTDVSPTGGGFITLGSITGWNIAIDDNEIMARNNGAVSDLNLQAEGGNVRVGGAIVHASDRRLKKDIENLPYGLKEIGQLEPKQYFWKKREVAENKSFGLIAQELQKVMPELVIINEDEAKTLSVNYTELIPVLINAIKEQDDKINRLEKELEYYEKLEERILALESNKTK